MAEKVKIDGDVGNAVNVESGASCNIIHVNKGQEENRNPQEVNRKTAELLELADPAGYKGVVECISQVTYGTKWFKSLSVEQLQKLQWIAGELIKHGDGVRAELNSVTEKLHALQIDYADLKGGGDSQSEAAKQRDQLKATSAFQLKQINELTSSVNSLRATNRDLEKRVAKSSGELQSLQSSLAIAEQALAKMSAQHTVAAKSVGKTRKGLLLALLLGLSATVSAAYFAALSDDHAETAKLAEANLRRCVFAGKAYPIGSVIEQSDGDDMRCAMQDKLMMAGWEEIKRDKPKRAAPVKRKPKLKPQQVEPAPEIKPTTTDDLAF